MTRGDFPKPLNMEPGMIMPVPPQYKIENVWDWRAVIGFLFYTATLLAAFKFIPSAQLFLFGLTLGSSAVALFRPFDKLVKYTEVPADYQPFVQDVTKFHSQYMNDPGTKKSE